MAKAARRWLSAAKESWSARDIPYSAATFSAVTPMWQWSNGSVTAPTMASTATASCIRRPQRRSGSQYWPRLIDSAPPATAASASPSMMAWAAEMMACSPLPHSRFTVSPGVLAGRPPLMAATRPRYMSLASVWITLPKTALAHVRGFHFGPGDRVAHDCGGEVAGRHGREAAAKFADSGPHAGQDHYFWSLIHDCSLTCPVRR